MSNKLTIVLVKRPNKKNIKSLDLTRKVNLLRHEKKVIIGHVLNNKYAQLLSFLRYNFYLRVNCTVFFKLFT